MIKTIAALLLLAPTMLSAQVVEVISGEHADFSRLVVLYGDVPEWEFGRVEGGYELRPADREAEYDLSSVFELIPRDRIGMTKTHPDGRIFLKVSCDCHADAFEIRTGLVIDIKDGAPGRRARFEARLQPLNRAAPDVMPVTRSPGASETTTGNLGLRYRVLRTDHVWQSELAADLVAPAVDEMAMTMDEHGAMGETDSLVEMATVDDHDTMRAVGELGAMDDQAAMPSMVEQDRVAEIQGALIAQLGRAAVQGLVTADLSETEMRIEASHPPQMRPEMQPSDHASGAEIMQDTMHTVDATDAAEAHIRIETALDRANSPDPILPPLTADGVFCLSEVDFDIAGWGVSPDPGMPLSPIRAGLVNELDVAVSDRIEALARQYIYMTFGAEVPALFAAFDMVMGNAMGNFEILLTLADIMDNGTSASGAVGKDQLACETRVAMWAVLAAPSLSPSDKISTEAVLAGFAELPLHLRRHLGPYLAEKFLSIHDADAASAIRNAVARAPGDHGENLAMMQARIALETGDTQHGTQGMKKIVANDGPLAPEALIQLIEALLASGQPLPADLLATVASHAFEARGSELGARLRRVHIRALAHSDEIFAALAATADANRADEISQDVARELRREILAIATGTGSDVEFLRTVQRSSVDIGRAENSGDLRRDIATRLIGLGLTDRARDILAENANVPGPKDRVAFARSYLADRRPDLVMGYLAGLTSPDAEMLRADAHALAGEFGRAATAYAMLGNRAAEARADWRAENWRQAALNGTEQERAAAEIAINPAEFAEGFTGSLAQNRGLLERSKETRQILADLLETTAKP